MKDVLQTIIESIVEDKSQIEITEKQNDRETIFEVKVSKEDMGRVIGREGRIAKSIRTLFKAVGAKEHKRVTVEFID